MRGAASPPAGRRPAIQAFAGRHSRREGERQNASHAREAFCRLADVRSDRFGTTPDRWDGGDWGLSANAREELTGDLPEVGALISLRSGVEQASSTWVTSVGPHNRAHLRRTLAYGSVRDLVAGPPYCAGAWS